ESKMHALDYWQVVRNRWGVILLTFFLVTLASVVIVALLDKKYVGKTEIQVMQNSAIDVYGTSEHASRLRAAAPFLETEFQVITAPEPLARVVDQRDLTGRWKMSKEEAIEKLGKMIETDQERGTEIIHIEVYSVHSDE